MVISKYVAALFAATMVAASIAAADSLFVGFNTQTPVQVYSLTGTYQQDFGPNGASAGIEENGLFYAVQPNVSGSSSTISALNSAQSVVSSFTVPDLISDGAPGQGGSLWLSGYDGKVYDVSTTGTILSSFDTGYTNIGIASNGSTLYTTEGDSSDGIDVRSTNGTTQSTIHTGYTSLYGLAYDSSNSSLYAGGFNFIYDFGLNGSLLNTLSVPGDSRTPNGAVHDGLELGDLSSLQSPTPPPPPPPPATVPEPDFGLLTGLILGVFILGRQFRNRLPALLKLVPALLLGVNAFGSVTVNFHANTNSAPVGAPVTFTASASDSSNPGATFTYQFSVKPSGAVSYSIVKDYYTSNTLTWTESSAEGVYDVQVIAKSSTGQSGFNIQVVNFTSRVTGSTPVVNPTQNSLVALYSAPPCSAPKRMRVRFRAQNATSWQATPFKTCNGLSMNFYVAGMRAQTTYILQQDLYNGPFDTPGPALSFKTGSLPGVGFPAESTLVGPTPPTSISFPFIMESRSYYPFAHDLNGNVVWYLAAMNNPQDTGYIMRNTSAGTVLVTMDDPNKPCATPGHCNNHEFLREYDLAGNLVRETNWNIVGQEVNALRKAQGQSPANLTWFSHEAFRMPNGDTATILTDERVANQGQGPVDVLGDLVAVLDTNFQVVWEWDSFDHLDIQRKALLNNVCGATPGCPPMTNKMSNGQIYTTANDWTHMNSVTLDPSDNNLVVSLRHQSWVLKLDYANGSGDGHIIWKLGMDGDFALPSGVSSNAWFSYQHCVQFQANGLLTLFDNGNYRVKQNGGGNSRGQAWRLDLSNMTATPVENFDLGVYSGAVGYASLLSNGNYDFAAGYINNGTVEQTSEFDPSGKLVYRDQVNSFSYRGIRLPDFYTQR